MSVDDVALVKSSVGDVDGTSLGDVGLMSGGRWRAVSGYPHTTFGLGWFCRRGLRSRWEADAWQGYGSNTAHPPDANSRQIVGSNIAASCWMLGTGSNGCWALKAAGFHNDGGPCIF